MPADWEPHRATVMLFCDAESVYDEGNWVQHIRKNQVLLARTIARYEKVILLVSARNEELARKNFGPSFDIRILDHCDMWARDTLTTQVIGEDGKLIGIDWNFNIWGEPARLNKYMAAYKADVGLMKGGSVSHLLSADRDGFAVEAARGVVTEGGAIDSDGEGTILTTESALLHDGPKRLHTAESKEGRKKRIEAELKIRTGAEKIIWLPGSTCEDDYTRGHIDGIARFVAPGHVLFEVAKVDKLIDEEKKNLKAVDGVRDAKGRPITVTLVESPRTEKMKRRSPEFAGLYVNFAFVNGAVILPAFGDTERDNDARRIFGDLFPDRAIEQISIDDICEAGGGIHCATQVIPLTAGFVGKRTGEFFSLGVDKSELHRLASEYAFDDNKWLGAGKALTQSGFNISNLEEIYRWKNKKRGRFDLVQRNAPDDLNEAIEVARRTTSDSVAISALSGLGGIGIPTASAILAAMFPERFTVIDVLALEALGIRHYSLTVPYYLDYLEYCRKLVAEHGIRPQGEASALRILDRALWQWSKEEADRKKKSGA